VRHWAKKTLITGLLASVGFPAGWAMAAAPSSVIPQDIFPQKAKPGQPAVAIVNNEALSEKKFINSLVLLSGMQLMRQWFELTLLKQACDKAGLHVGKKQIQAQMNFVMANLAAQKVPADERLAALQRVLASRGESLPTFELGLARTAYIEALAKGHVRVTKKQIRLSYESQYGPKVLVRDIVVPGFSQAVTVRDLIEKKHDSAAKVAETYSVAKQSAANGGEVLIPLKDTTIPRIFRSTAAHLRKGHLSSGIPMGNDIHLLWLVKKVPAQNVPFSSVEKQIKASLTRIMELRWGQREIAKLVAAAKIKIKDPVLHALYSELKKQMAAERAAMENAKQKKNPLLPSNPVPNSKSGLTPANIGGK
jgi:parvulin-like peptidyl-prolyl isomerase